MAERIAIIAELHDNKITHDFTKQYIQKDISISFSAK